MRAVFSTEKFLLIYENKIMFYQSQLLQFAFSNSENFFSVFFFKNIKSDMFFFFTMGKIQKYASEETASAPEESYEKKDCTSPHHSQCLVNRAVNFAKLILLIRRVDMSTQGMDYIQEKISIIL